MTLRLPLLIDCFVCAGWWRQDGVMGSCWPQNGWPTSMLCSMHSPLCWRARN